MCRYCCRDESIVLPAPTKKNPMFQRGVGLIQRSYTPQLHRWHSARQARPVNGALSAVAVRGTSSKGSPQWEAIYDICGQAWESGAIYPTEQTDRLFSRSVVGLFSRSMCRLSYFHCNHLRGHGICRGSATSSASDSLLECTEWPPQSQVTTTGGVVKTFSTKRLQQYESLWEGKTENSIFSHANLSHILPARIKSI